MTASRCRRASDHHLKEPVAGLDVPQLDQSEICLLWVEAVTDVLIT